MTDHLSYCNGLISERAKHAAMKKMPVNWDRTSVTMLNVFHAYLLEALFSELNSHISMAHAHGYVSGLMKGQSVSQSLKTFYEELK